MTAGAVARPAGREARGTAAPSIRVEGTRARGGPRAVWAFVALGAGLRLVRYALGSPLWWNEAFVGVNLLKRGYADLLRPLDYGQVCPVGFLWVEKAATDLLGFSEWTLRLAPLICGLAALGLFARVAGRFAAGSGGTLAVAVLAVAYHPIRLASEVKPYATDLLASLVLTWLALGWLRDRGRTARLWGLAVAGPLAVAASHPAAFVAAGVGLGLAPAAWRSGTRGARVALGAFGLATALGFLGLYALYTSGQGAATLAGMRAYWAEAFPPVGSPGDLPAWLVRTHAGRFLAYPFGGDRGGSAVPLALAVLGAAVIWRRGDRAALAVLLGPFLVTLAAAAAGRHPYGGHPRIGQHLAPAVCLLVGVGAGSLIDRRPAGRPRRRAWRLAVVALLGVGLVPLAGDVARPYRTEVEHLSREFARRFWPEQAAGAELVCLRWDVGLAAWESADLDTALYLCNQRIYSPQRPGGPRPGAASGRRPRRCVLYRSDRDEGPDLAPWLDAMRRSHRLVGQSDHPIPGPAGPRGRVTVFTFLPGSADPVPVSPGPGRIQSGPSDPANPREDPRDGRRRR